MTSPNLTAVALAALFLPAPLFGQLPTVNSFEANPTNVIKGGTVFLEWDVAGADSVSIDQGVGGDLPGAGTVQFDAGGAVVLVPTSATWKYSLDGGAGIGDTGAEIVSGNAFYNSSNWKHPDYDDSDAAVWAEGPGSLGYGDAHTTEIPYGPNPDNADNDGQAKFLAYYFRHEFNLTAGEIADLDFVLMELQRDDGAIVYINGVQVLATGMPPGFVDSATEADATAGGAVETTFFRQIVDPSIFRAGENTVAIEVHQANETSSDVTMSFRLSNVSSGVVREELLPPGSEWRYLDDGGESLGDADDTSSDIVAGTLRYGAPHWKHPDFDDSAWKSGAGVFGYDTTGFDENNLIDFGGDPQNKHITYYFRKRFTIADQSQLDAIDLATVELRRDDGAVVYMNGREVGRSNIAAAPAVISATTTAGGTIVSETEYQELRVAPSFFQVGENTVAVEVHQSSRTSSDLSFDLALVVEDAVGTLTDLISRESEWKYLDDGSALDASDIVLGNPGYDDQSWKHPDFDDAAWSSGYGELGYGDGSGTPQAFVTELDYRARLNKYRTAYFRTDFTASLAALASYDEIEIRYRRDDGLIVYINGVEVVRDNMETGTTTRDSVASGNAPDDGDELIVARVPKSVIQDGRNVIAAELHQAPPTAGGELITSSDTVFDLLLAGVRPASSVTYTLTATNGEGSTEAQTTVNFVDPPEGKVFLTTSNVAGLNWSMPGVWSDGQAPREGVHYVVYPSFAEIVRTPATGDAFFGGESLEIQGNGVLAMSGFGDLLELIMNGGQIWNEVGGGAVTGLGIDGPFGTIISVVDDMRIQNRGSDRTLEISGNLSGAADIEVLAPNTTTSPSLTAVSLRGGNDGYTGTITVFDTLLADDGPNLGSGTVVIGDGGFLGANLDFETPVSASVQIAATGGIIFSSALSIESGKLSIDGNTVPDGVYTAGSLAGLGFGGVFDDLGSVVIVGESTFVDTDNDLMDDAWELEVFGDLDVSDGTGDFDGDGQSDLSEYYAATDPKDAASALVITNVARVAGTGDVTVAWIGREGVVYRVQYSDDLRAWTDFSGTFAGVGPHVFTDDGSESAPPPTAARERCYRVKVVRF